MGSIGENEGGSDGAVKGGGGGVVQDASGRQIDEDRFVHVEGKGSTFGGGGDGGLTFGGSGIGSVFICSLSTCRKAWLTATYFLAKGGVGFRVGGGEMSSEHCEGVIRMEGKVVV